MSQSTTSSSSSSSSNSSFYRTLRRLPPFYTMQPNTQSQAKQLQGWSSFLLDAAVVAFKETGALGISITPHSPVFRSPREVNRVLSANGARFVLRSLMEQHGGYRCLPLALDQQSGLDDEAEQIVAAQQAAAAKKQLTDADNDDGFDDVTESPAGWSSATGAAGSLFLNCDAVVVLALPCEKFVEALWKWHDEDQTSHIFSVSEIAEDKDLKKRIRDALERAGAGAVDLGEPVVSVGQKQQHQSSSPSSLLLSPLDNATIIDALMTTEHPALAHLKRPTLITASGGSLGLKFA